MKYIDFSELTFAYISTYHTATRARTYQFAANLTTSPSSDHRSIHTDRVCGCWFHKRACVCITNAASFRSKKMVSAVGWRVWRWTTDMFSLNYLYVSKFHQYANAPMYQCTNAPMHQCTNAPMHQCTNALMHQCTNAPMRQCTSAPMHQCTCSEPMHRFKNNFIGVYLFVHGNITFLAVVFSSTV